MALNIILGASGSGKTTRCFEEIDKKIKSESDSKMFMLVPEQFTFEGEKKLIDNLKARKDITVLFITHRESVLFNCDYEITVLNGKVQES